MKGFWKVGLVEFHANASKAKVRPKPVDTTIYVFSNFVKESILDGKEQPVLRRLQLNDRNGWSYVFETPIYVPVKNTDLQEFEIFIKAEDGTLASFIDAPVALTLHLKRYPFYLDYESL